MEKDGCIILRANEYADHHVGEENSGCFYYQPLALDTLVKENSEKEKSTVVRAGRIEVRDTDIGLHQHNGLVVVFITSGNGIFKTSSGETKVHQGDVVYIPPNTPHLSISDKGTVMIEHIVYISNDGDLQDPHPV